MKNRRSLTPPPPGDASADGVHATRRGGARREISARVTMKSASGQLFDGWALNVSKGGVRVILEDKVDPGAEFEVTVLSVAAPSAPVLGANGGSPVSVAASAMSCPAAPQTGRVVWVQEEPDGVVIGIEFVADAKP